MPVGIYKYEWTSAEFVAEVFSILVQEVLGYNATFSGSSSLTVSGVFAVAGCDPTYKVSPCDSDVVPQTTHVALEFWPNVAVTPKTIEETYEIQPPEELGSIGYTGIDGVFVLSSEEGICLEESGVHLDFYGSYNASWFNVRKYFDAYTDIPLSSLKPCTEAKVHTSSPSMSNVARWTPDADGFQLAADGSVQAHCPDGFWWLSPTCRAHPERCVPWITGGDGWHIDHVMQKAIAFDMPLALATAATWDDYIASVSTWRALAYTWEPAVHFITLNLVAVLFPLNDAAQHGKGDFRTLNAAEDLSKLAHAQLVNAAPSVRHLAKEMTFTPAVLSGVLNEFARSGDDAGAVACRWLQGTDAWRAWLPTTDETACPVGQGLVNSLGDFVGNRSLAVMCSLCRTGNYSEGMSDAIGKTHICKRCPAGTSQALWGSAACTKCEAGYHQDRTGESMCERCAKGAYSSVGGSSSCEPCPIGRTTDGTGFRAEEDCQCPPGTFHSNVSGCVACGEGAVCQGFGAAPQATMGYHLSAISDDELSVFSCFGNTQRCPGGGLGACAEGRMGVACGRCKPYMTPGDQGKCKPCNRSDAGPFTLVVLVCCGTLTAMYFVAGLDDRAKQKRSSLLVAMSIAQVIGVGQVLGVVSKMSIDWKGPIRSLMKLLHVLNFDIELLRVDCVATLSSPWLYISTVSMLPLGVAYLVLLHLATLLVLRLGGCGRQYFALTGSVGMLFKSLFITITTAILSPFQCVRHPNGQWTMLQYNSQRCWTTSNHTAMLAVGAVACLMPAGFIAGVVVLLLRFPKRMRMGDVEFLNTFAFLFSRVKPSAHWFMLVVLLRSAAVALVPTIPGAFWQVMLMHSIFTISGFITVAALPWRLTIINGFETAFSACMVGFMCLAGFFVTNASLEGVEHAAFVCLVGIPCAFVGTAAYGCYLRLAVRSLSYRFFLCHHKAATGAFARLLKIALVEQGGQGPGVFLDSDNLDDLDRLFNVVVHRTTTLVALCSRELLRRPWCLCEIVAAHIGTARTLPLYFPDFMPPEDGFIQEVQSIVETKVLTEQGLKIEVVREALRAFRGTEHLEIPLHFDSIVFHQLVEKVVKEDMTTINRKSGLVGEASTTRDPQVAVLSDMSSREATATALILLALLRPLMVHNTSLMPVLYQDLVTEQHEAPSSMPKALVVLCTDGCFSKAHFLLGLVFAQQAGVAFVVPVAVHDSFKFPTGDSYAELERTVSQLCGAAGAEDTPALLTPYVAAIFKKIALRFDNVASLRTLEAQAALVAKRLEESAQPNIEVDTSKAQVLAKLSDPAFLLSLRAAGWSISDFAIVTSGLIRTI